MVKTKSRGKEDYIYNLRGSKKKKKWWLRPSCPGLTPSEVNPCVMSSVQFSRSVVSDSLRPHGLQHARLPYPSPIPGVYSNSRSLSWWCHPTISSFVVPFSSCLLFSLQSKWTWYHRSSLTSLCLGILIALRGLNELIFVIYPEWGLIQNEKATLMCVL